MAGESRGAQKDGTDGPAAVAGRARMDWLDALKGVGILAVVAGHLWTQGPLREAIYVFHMPLFFLASGYAAHSHPMRLLAPRLLRALGLPWLCFAVLLLGGDLVIEHARHMRPLFATPWEALTALILATETLRGPFAIFWFAPCLFFARLAWNGLLRAGGRPGRGWLPWAMIAVALLAYGLAARVTVSPLGLLPMPAALLLLWLGALGRDWRPPAALVWLLWPAALAVLLTMPPLNMRAGDLGPPLLGLAGAALVVERLVAFVRVLPPWAMAPLVRLGRATLAIMYVHVAFIHYLAPYAPKYALFPVALGGALLVDALARSSRAGRFFLLGEK